MKINTVSFGAKKKLDNTQPENKTPFTIKNDNYSMLQTNPTKKIISINKENSPGVSFYRLLGTPENLKNGNFKVPVEEINAKYLEFEIGGAHASDRGINVIY